MVVSHMLTEGQVYFCTVIVNSRVVICTLKLSSAHWQQASKYPALRRLELI